MRSQPAPALDWRFARFADLSLAEFYEALALRQRVFVVEQKILYPDCDGRDPHAWHLSGWVGGALIAYARLFPPTERDGRLAIGRFAVAAQMRGTGLGRAMMHEALRRARELAPEAVVKIAAQAHLQRFYGSLGFATVSEVYDQYGIPHVDMILEG